MNEGRHPLSISVIIPTYNRVSALMKTLESLSKQNLEQKDLEVVIVDDGSTDETKRMLQENDLPFQIRYSYQQNQGAAIARNNGSLIANNDFLVFIDDDIIVDKNYLDEMNKEHDGISKRLVMGSCYLRIENPTSPFHVFMSQLDFFPAPEPSFDQVCSNNMGISKDDYRSLGGMRKMTGGGNDTWCDLEFAYRAHLEGFEFKRNQRALCFHYDLNIEKLDRYLNRIEKSAAEAVRLFELHPDLRNKIPMFMDKTPINVFEDSPILLWKKLIRACLSNLVAITLMNRVISLAEKQFPNSNFLRRSYLLRIAASIYRGYHQGLNN